MCEFAGTHARLPGLGVPAGKGPALLTGVAAASALRSLGVRKDYVYSHRQSDGGPLGGPRELIQFVGLTRAKSCTEGRARPEYAGYGEGTPVKPDQHP